MSMVYCRGCGKEIHESATDCPFCGAKQGFSNRYSNKSEKNKIVAGLLALFLGGFGIHRFYLGKVKSGILYVLFCWTFIPAIIAFIEAIIIFFSSDESWRQQYNEEPFKAEVN